jgi:arylsulfatase
MDMPKKPNIVYIFSDQHRGDTMGCAGNPAAITPNMDRLAAEGVNFKQCRTNSPL